MADNNLLGRLDGLVSRFEEVGTLITDPAVIADMKRFVKLNKEYRDLEKIVTTRNEYVNTLNGINEARQMLDTEQDPEMREIAREELDACNARIPELEEEIKLLLVPSDPEDDKNAIVEIRGGTGATRPPFLPATSIACISNTAKPKAGKSPCQVAAKVRRADIKKLFSPLAVRKHMVRSNMNRAYIVFSVYPVLKLRDVYTPQQLPWLCSPKQTSLMLKLMKVKLSGILSVREVPAARM